MASTFILVFSLLAQLRVSDVVSPIGATSGNTTSGGPGGLSRSDANLEDASGPFTGGTAPMTGGSDSIGALGTTGSSDTGTSTAAGTSSGTSTDVPISRTTSASGIAGGTSGGTGIGSTSGGMR